MAMHGKNEIIRLRSTAKAEDGKKTGYTYTTTINRSNRAQKSKTGKFRIRKYDPVVKKHVEFEEIKSSN